MIPTDLTATPAALQTPPVAAAEPLSTLLPDRASFGELWSLELSVIPELRKVVPVVIAPEGEEVADAVDAQTAADDASLASVEKAETERPILAQSQITAEEEMAKPIARSPEEGPRPAPPDRRNKRESSAESVARPPEEGTEPENTERRSGPTSLAEGVTLAALSKSRAVAAGPDLKLQPDVPLAVPNQAAVLAGDIKSAPLTAEVVTTRPTQGAGPALPQTVRTDQTQTALTNQIAPQDADRPLLQAVNPVAAVARPLSEAAQTTPQRPIAAEGRRAEGPLRSQTSDLPPRQTGEGAPDILSAPQRQPTKSEKVDQRAALQVTSPSQPKSVEPPSVGNVQAFPTSRPADAAPISRPADTVPTPRPIDGVPKANVTAATPIPRQADTMPTAKSPDVSALGRSASAEASTKPTVQATAPIDSVVRSATTIDEAPIEPELRLSDKIRPDGNTPHRERVVATPTPANTPARVDAAPTAPRPIVENAETSVTTPAPQSAAQTAVQSQVMGAYADGLKQTPKAAMPIAARLDKTETNKARPVDPAGSENKVILSGTDTPTIPAKREPQSDPIPRVEPERTGERSAQAQVAQSPAPIMPTANGSVALVQSPMSLSHALKEDAARELPQELDFAAQQTTTTSSAAVAPSAAVPRAMAPYVAQQIAAAVAQSTTDTTQISLNPEELGRVRITLTSAEGGLVVSIMAERPETADLMRRNIDTLMKEFADLGYDDPSFNFEGQDQQSDADPSDQNSGSGPMDSPQPLLVEQIETQKAHNGGLNLKL